LVCHMALQFLGGGWHEWNKVCHPIQTIRNETPNTINKGTRVGIKPVVINAKDVAIHDSWSMMQMAVLRTMVELTVSPLWTMTACKDDYEPWVSSFSWMPMM
jgi:hypothetical protein